MLVTCLPPLRLILLPLSFRPAPSPPPSQALTVYGARWDKGALLPIFLPPLALCPESPLPPSPWALTVSMGSLCLRA